MAKKKTTPKSKPKANTKIKSIRDLSERELNGIRGGGMSTADATKGQKR